MPAKENKKNVKNNAELMNDATAREIFALKGERPNLAIVIMGKKHARFSRIKDLEKEAGKVGIDVNLYICDPESPEAAILEVLDYLNSDTMIDSILVMRPLPVQIGLEAVKSRLAPRKEAASYEKEPDDWEDYSARLFRGVLDAYLRKRGRSA